MLWRLLLIYAGVELAAIIALVSTIGFGWTVLVLLASFVLGWALMVPMAGSQLVHHVGQLRSGLKNPRRALGDGALVTLATGLVVVPGLVTTALGILLLVPPIRAVAGSGLAAVTMRGLQRRMPLITTFAAGVREGEPAGERDYIDYIDGEVIDVTDGEPPTLPTAPTAGGPRERSARSPY